MLTTRKFGSSFLSFGFSIAFPGLQSFSVQSQYLFQGQVISRKSEFNLLLFSPSLSAYSSTLPCFSQSPTKLCRHTHRQIIKSDGVALYQAKDYHRYLVPLFRVGSNTICKYFSPCVERSILLAFWVRLVAGVMVLAGIPLYLPSVSQMLKSMLVILPVPFMASMACRVFRNIKLFDSDVSSLYPISEIRFS